MLFFETFFWKRWITMDIVFFVYKSSRAIKVHGCSIFLVGRYLSYFERFYSPLFLLWNILICSLLFLLLCLLFLFDFDVAKSTFFPSNFWLTFFLLFCFSHFCLLLSFLKPIFHNLLRDTPIWPIHIQYDNWNVCTYSLLSNLFFIFYLPFSLFIFLPPHPPTPFTAHFLN